MTSKTKTRRVQLVRVIKPTIGDHTDEQVFKALFSETECRELYTGVFSVNHTTTPESSIERVEAALRRAFEKQLWELKQNLQYWQDKSLDDPFRVSLVCRAQSL